MRLNFFNKRRTRTLWVAATVLQTMVALQKVTTERMVDFPRAVRFVHVLVISLVYIFSSGFSIMEFPLILATVVTLATNKNERKAKDRTKFIYTRVHTYHRHHSAVCLTTGPQPLPNPVLHTMRSTASSFDLLYILISLRSFSNCLRLLPHLPITSSQYPFFNNEF